MLITTGFLVFGVLALISSVVIIYDSIKKRQGLKDAIIAVFMIPVGIACVSAALNVIF